MKELLTEGVPLAPPVIKNCKTCVHEYNNKCLIGGLSCSLQRILSDPKICDYSLSGWQPKPIKQPRRSLRKWLYDLLWRKD